MLSKTSSDMTTGSGKDPSAPAVGSLYIVAAPSGAGKTSLVNRLLKCTPGVEVSVSHTTRPPRPGERNGVNYHFVDAPAFQTLLDQGVFLEYARVYEHFYGTSRETVLEQLEAGIDVVLEIDWQGARQVRAQIPDSHTIFILPPSRRVLRERLKKRGQDSDAVIEQRMERAASEMSHYDEFDYLVINDDFDEALDALRAILIANRQRRSRQVRRHSDLFRTLLS